MSTTLGFEAAGSALEKFLPGVSLPILLTTVLPGLLAGGALYPFVTPSWRNSLSLDVEKTWPQLVVMAIAVLTLGALISALNGEFYKIYEGRILWPKRLWNWAKARQQSKVERLLRRANAEKGNIERYKEVWYRLRSYPLDPDTGETIATHPTLLGNILSGYEQYPKTRYGMDAIFYWTRLWMVVDKDQREEINRIWVIADGLLNLSGVGFLAALLWLCMLVGVELGLWGPYWFPVKSGFDASITAIVGWFVLGYGIYRLSLSFHRQNGEVFKSLFDMYRDKLHKMTSLAPDENELWRAAWAYLQYLRVKCPKCGRYISAIAPKCGNPQCDVNAAEVVEKVMRSGKLLELAGQPPSEKSEIAELLKALCECLQKKP
jgi:hypothetical protein